MRHNIAGLCLEVSMRLARWLLAALLVVSAAPVACLAATIGGYYYAPQYDYREFFAATDGKPFQVVLLGNPFPGLDPTAVARALLPAMQAAKDRKSVV